MSARLLSDQVSNLSTQSKSELEIPKLLTTKKLWAAFFVQLNEAYQITVLLPMVVFMCRDFGIEPHMLGVYTSLLNASFMFCQFLVSYFWGTFSDKYGRRPALVIGLIFSTIGVLVFGCSTSYVMAMSTRCICGLCNGNMGVIKAWLSDITDSSNRGWAFSMIAISFGFGNVLGSMMGGLLIVTTDVDLPDNEYKPTVGIWNFWIFYDVFPFLMPCLVGALISFNAMLWTLYQVKNENQALLTRMALLPPDGSMGYTAIKDNETDSTLISVMEQRSENAISEICIYDAAVSIYQTSNSCSLPMLFGEFNTNTQKKPLLSHSKDRLMTELDQEEIHSLSELVKKTDLIKTLLCYVIIAICTMMFREMNPVYMAQALAFDSQLIGFCQAWSGFSLLFWTFWFQPYFLRTFEHRNIAVFNSIMAAIVMLLTPSIYWMVFIDGLNKKWIQMIAAFGCETLMVMFVSILFVISMCFINNSVPPQHCGKANGLAQSFASLVRAIGPVMTGFIWSESVQYIDTAKYAVYWAYLPSFLGFMLMALHIYCNIKAEYQYIWEKQIELKNRKMGIRTLGFTITGNIVGNV